MLGLGLAALVVGGCASNPSVSERKVKDCSVDIVYVGPDAPCAVALAPEIYAPRFGNLGKCKKVRWWVDDSLGYEWKIVHNPAKGTASVRDQLGGPYAISANHNTVESERVKKNAQKQDADWAYKIEVSDHGAPVCTADPIIIIRK